MAVCQKFSNLLVAVAFVLAVGCHPTVERLPGKRARQEAAIVIPEVQEADYTRLAERFVAALNRHDPQALTPFVDNDVFFKRAKVPDKFRDMAHRRLGDFISKHLLPNQVGEGDFVPQYKLLRVGKERGEVKAVCRIIHADADNLFGYLDLILAPNAAGEVRIVDLSSYAHGRRLSEMFASRDVDPASLEGCKRMIALMKEGRHEKVLEELDRLPQSVRRDPFVLHLWLKAASKIGVQEYSVAVESVKLDNPKFPGLPFLELTNHRARREHAAALECLDRIDDIVGGDPYLDVERSIVYMDDGRWDAAKAAGENALKREPTLEDAYWVFVQLALHDKNHDETLRRLRQIDDKFGGELEGLETRAEYAEFIKTPQWQEWQKQLNRKSRK